jgi:hypothetical protein
MLQTQQLDFLFGRLHKSLVKKIYPFTPSRLCYWIDVHGRKKMVLAHLHQWSVRNSPQGKIISIYEWFWQAFKIPLMN